MIDIDKEITRLVDFAISNGLIEERDRNYGTNRILKVLQLDSYAEPTEPLEKTNSVEDILENIRTWAVENNRVENDTVVELDLLDTEIMAQIVKMPSAIESEFNHFYNISPKEATDYYYRLARKSNYIRERRVAKDIKWKCPSPYGELDISINLSKPEKDPRTIAKSKTLKDSNYPICPLCKENEGYGGRLNHPARGNHRIIELALAEEKWFFQYSPYSYYNEHCIILRDEHIPMKIVKKTFRRLLEFVNLFPHYFIGSNADLPIVGGSILSHDHYQGGNYTFPMAKAQEENHISLGNGIEACSLNWPMSVIRLKGDNIDKVVETSYEIFCRWKDYSDEEVSIIAESNGNPHNTITPICRYREGLYEMDLVLRNNRTTEERPYGLFHPREEYHHIKKENIGLIEVMGLAILPSRLKYEMESLKNCLLKGDIDGIKKQEELVKHLDWAMDIMEKHDLTEKNIDCIIQQEIGKVFLAVLEDAGVFKNTHKGRMAFEKCKANLFKGMGGEI